LDGEEVSRIGVYDRYWNTYGGGEQFAGGIAGVLSERHDVDLIGPQAVDVPRQRERLGLELERCGMRLIDTERDVTSVSADYDLLINTTFLSNAACHARRGLYVVHFPGALTNPKTVRLDQARTQLTKVRKQNAVVFREGFLPQRADIAGRLTDGVGVIEVCATAGAQVEIDVAAPRWPDDEQPRVQVRTLAGAAFDDVLAPGQTATATLIHDGSIPMVAWVTSPSHAPDALGLPWHLRRVGAAVTGIRVNGQPLPLVGGRIATRLLPPDRLGFLDTYQRIVSNAIFTQGWVDKLWHQRSDVLYPPVRRFVPTPAADGSGAAPKENIILSLGRFFGSEGGHSKKQLEMVEAFRLLAQSGGAGDWTLHLVGGCSKEYRDYAMAVKRAAVGLNVQVHLNAPGALVQDLLGKASIYWHATGFGEDVTTHPDRFEHFGISVVEAMSAGAVPVVLNQAGPAEIVRAGQDGEHFTDLADLARRTAALIANPTRRATLAASAQERAEYFGFDAFRPRLFTLVDELLD
jgi:glycosyltransferase involved in cell wall biosynthesis